MAAFTSQQIQFFTDQGYLVVPGLANEAQINQFKALVRSHLDNRVEPFELECDVAYPGAPQSTAMQGGDTIRRLRMAYDRHPMFAEWATSGEVVSRVKTLLGGCTARLVRAHHNCIMTKQPEFSSQTGWHKDIRYWSYEHPELISVWLALGPEDKYNGALRVLPGTHRMQFSPDQYDKARFFRQDSARNQALLRNAVDLKLNAGDVLFFHANLLHAAGKNQTGECKSALVFTYRPLSNLPVAGSHSAAVSEVDLE